MVKFILALSIAILSLCSTKHYTPARWYKPVLNVWIETPYLVDRDTQDVPNVVRAMDRWESEVSPTFKFIEKRDSADIEVLWTESLPNSREGNPVAGLTTFAIDTVGNTLHIKHILIQLAMTHRYGILLSADERYALALHEVGHSLGLGHSNNRHDIMSPIVYVNILSDADRQALDSLYRGK